MLHDGWGVPFPSLQAGVLVGTQVFYIIMSFIPPPGGRGFSPWALIGLSARGGFPSLLRLAPYVGARTRLSTISPQTTQIVGQLASTGGSRDEDARRYLRARLQHRLQERRLSAEEEMLIFDNLVTDGFICADPTLRPMLDQWSLRALQLGPGVKTLVGSRGAVLVELGRHGEGKALLDTLVQADDTAPFDALMMSCLFLARAEQALGNPTAAVELMTKVTKTRAAIAAHGEIDPALIGLIERIDRETHTSQ